MIAIESPLLIYNYMCTHMYLYIRSDILTIGLQCNYFQLVKYDLKAFRNCHINWLTIIGAQ